MEGDSGQTPTAEHQSDSRHDPNLTHHGGLGHGGRIPQWARRSSADCLRFVLVTDPTPGAEGSTAPAESSTPGAPSAPSQPGAAETSLRRAVLEAEPAIEIIDVVKTFGSTTAVDGLSLTVPRGICLGLLGPNGAGKSTTMKMLTGQAIPTSGEIRVLGFDVPGHGKQARARMGVVPQNDNLDVDMTCEQILSVWAQLCRVPRGQRAAAVDEALEIAQLTDRRDDKVNSLSGGMRRRLLIARGLVHHPELVLLDEPTVGLDPQVRAGIWSLIDRLRSEGVTTLMSTHYIEEAERLADLVAVVSHGKVIAEGTPQELLALHAGERAVEWYGPPERLHEIEEVMLDAGLPTRRTGPSISVLRAEALPTEVYDAVNQRHGQGVERVANLEDVFVLLTGERLDG